MATAAALAARPTTTVEIGGTEYTARCPKLSRWQSFAALDGDAVAAAEAAGDQQALAAQYLQLLALVRRWMQAALGREQWAELEERLDDDDDDLDEPDLYQPFGKLVAMWRPAVTEQAKGIGVQLAKLPTTVAEQQAEAAEANGWQVTPEKKVRRAGSRPSARKR